MSGPQFRRRATEAAAFLLVAVLAGLYAAGGCAKSEPRAVKHELTERERDSILATEKAIPGSATVGRALEVSDSASAQAERQNSSTQ